MMAFLTDFSYFLFFFSFAYFYFFSIKANSVWDKMKDCSFLSGGKRNCFRKNFVDRFILHLQYYF